MSVCCKLIADWLKNAQPLSIVCMSSTFMNTHGTNWGPLRKNSSIALIPLQITLKCTDKITITENKPCLKIQQLIIDLFNVDVRPEDVVVAIDCLDDTVVQAIQLLQQSKLLPNLQELGVLGDRESEQLLSTRVGDVLPEQVVKSILRERTAVHIIITATNHVRKIIGVYLLTDILNLNIIYIN